MAHDQALSSSLTAALLEELAVVVGALVGEVGVATATSDEVVAEWMAESTLTGPLEGTIALGFPREGTVTLAKAVLGLETPPSDAAVVDLIKEIAAQAFSSLGQRPEAAGATLTPASIGTGVPPGAASVHAIGLGPALAPLVACWCDARVARASEPPRPAAALQLEIAGPPVTASTTPSNLDVILDIDLPLTVRFGMTEMTLDALTGLGPGSVIDLGRTPDDPVEVLVNGRLVARGEVVVVSGNYGVRIQEVVSAADRLRSLADPA